MHPIRITLALLAATLPATFARAQDPEAMREIQEIARRIDTQLQEIDQLLLESGRKGQERAKPKELLQQAGRQSEAVEGGIDELIDKLNKMKSQGGSGSPDEQSDPSQDPQQQQQQQQRQQQQQQGQQQGQQRNRRENQTPDLVDQRKRDGQEGQPEQPQPGQQPGQQQGQQQPQPGEQPGGQQPQGQPQDGKPEGGQEAKDGGQNRPGGKPDDGGTGPASQGTGDGSWGDLQPYMNFLKNRGSRPPDVPEKFRKYWEAYLKQKQAGGAGGSGAGGSGGGR
jgi:hypothetical protein